MDTDKYEGCSKTAWRCVGQPYTELAEAMAEIHRNGPNSCTPADLELLADAPLLLAEVKRLRRAFRIATAHIGFGNHLGHNELRRALNSMGIDYNSLPWAEEEFKDLSVFGGVAHYD